MKRRKTRFLGHHLKPERLVEITKDKVDCAVDPRNVGR